MASGVHAFVATNWDIGMIEVRTSGFVHLCMGKDTVDDGSPSWRYQMLRIQRSGNGETVYRLSGRMDRENIAELETLLGSEPSGKSIVLDLKNITLSGQDGIDFLARCEAADIKLSNCPLYIRDWIRRQPKKEGESL
jgi:hypothetical protein